MIKLNRIEVSKNVNIKMLRIKTSDEFQSVVCLLQSLGAIKDNKQYIFLLQECMREVLTEAIDEIGFVCKETIEDGVSTLAVHRPPDENDTGSQGEDEGSCRHVWVCLRGRTHNRGNGKYQAYKCRECGAFQRR